MYVANGTCIYIVHAQLALFLRQFLRRHGIFSLSQMKTQHVSSQEFSVGIIIMLHYQAAVS